MSDKLPPIFDGLLEHLQREGGRIVIGYANEDLGVPAPGEPHERWLIGYEFGREADDSDMAGGAAYGVGVDLDSAVQQVADQVGLG